MQTYILQDCLFSTFLSQSWSYQVASRKLSSFRQEAKRRSPPQHLHRRPNYFLGRLPSCSFLSWKTWHRRCRTWLVVQMWSCDFRAARSCLARAMWRALSGQELQLFWCVHWQGVMTWNPIPWAPGLMRNMHCCFTKATLYLGIDTRGVIGKSYPCVFPLLHSRFIQQRCILCAMWKKT